MKSKNWPSPLAGEGKYEGEIKILPKCITFFIDSNGSVTISDLFADVLPLAASLNPSDERISKFLINSRLNVRAGQRETESR